MTDEEQFMYDLLLSEVEQQQEEEAYMMEILEQEIEAFDEERLDEEEYERIGREFDDHAEEDKEAQEEFISEYELDPFWPDDDWLDAGEEWELAPDYEEG